MQIEPDASRKPPRASIIIPALDERVALPGTLEAIGRQAAEGLEVILADGGSTDGTVELFFALTRCWMGRGWAVRSLVAGRPGRAVQMNAGARLATGDVLVFLHADTRLPPGALAAVGSALADPAILGGGFRHRFQEPGALLRLISAWATARSRLLGIHYGDQAMFVRRALFERLGGFPGVPLFEDLELARALRARGRVLTLPLAVRTSARRLRHGGIGRTAARFAWLKIRRALGADPARLGSGYPDVR